MHQKITDFKLGVYEQARARGHDHYVAEAIASQAVLDRVSQGDAGFALAQEEDFSAIEIKTFELGDVSYHVDQAGDGSVIVEGVLLTTTDDVVWQSFSESVFPDYAAQINAGAVMGYVDEHGEFRTTFQRSGKNSVTEWVKARVENGKLYVAAKLKKGYEWVADKFRALSIEATVPKSKTLVMGKKKQYHGGKVHGFVFTNKPKNEEHYIQKVQK